MTIESEAVKIVAGLMALSARTAPKAVGLDSIKIEIISGKEQERLAKRMIKLGTELKIDFFCINGEQVKVSDVTLLIGVEGHIPLGINCEGCGHPSCAERVKALRAKKTKTSMYPGPNCVLKITDLGIAVGSAVKTGSIHNVDNRIMFSAGVIALQMGWACSKDAALRMVSLSKRLARTSSGICSSWITDTKLFSSFTLTRGFEI